MEQKIFFHVDLDAKIYRAFCTFDSIRRTGSWRRPTIFAVMLLAFAVVCFCLTGLNGQAVLLGVVLAVIGLGLPAAYFGTFFQSVNGRIKKFQLDNGRKRHAYDVMLTDCPDGIEVVSEKTAPLKFNWKDLFMAYHCNGVIYLYVEQTKAYILPETATQDDLEKAWAIITKCAPQGKTKAFGK